MAYRKFIGHEICSTTAQRTIIRKHITVCFLKDEYVRLFLAISNGKNRSKKCIR